MIFVKEAENIRIAMAQETVLYAMEKKLEDILVRSVLIAEDAIVEIMASSEIVHSAKARASYLMQFLQPNMLA